MAITDRGRSAGSVQPVRTKPTKALPPPLNLYQSAVGKKFVMALTGLGLVGFVLFHMLGNFKIYLGAEDINQYGESLRDLGGHLVPRTHVLWLARFGLIAMFALHIHSAYSLALLSRKSNALKYQQTQKFTAANFASRSMRWTGTIVGLYVLFHLADLTWGVTDDDWVRGDAYNNMVRSFQRVPVAILYVLANITLAIHLYHGMGSMFRTLSLNNPRFEGLPRLAAVAVAGAILVGNLSFPIAIQLGIVDYDAEARAEVLAHSNGDGEETSTVSNDGTTETDTNTAEDGG